MKDPIAISVTLLMGLQSMGYYAALTWIPSMLTSAGMDAHAAGWMLSFSAFPAIPAALFTPALSKRIRPRWLLVVVSAVLTGAGYCGVAFSPLAGTYVWMTLMGLGQGVVISLALSYIVGRSPDSHHTGHLSTMAQGYGYILAGFGPLGLGVLHSATGGWMIPLVALGVVLAAQVVFGSIASQDRHVLAGKRPVNPGQSTKGRELETAGRINE